MNILVFTSAFEPAVRAGGPARSITNLVRTISQQHQVVVVAPDRDLGDSEPFPGLSGKTLTRGNAKIFYVSESSPRQWTSLLRRLSRQQFDLVVVNSIWNHRYALIPVMLKSMHVLDGPVLLLPRGELEPGALALKSGKKRWAGPAFRAAYRRGVSVFGATSDAEATNIRAWFPGKPVVTTTNNLPDAIPWGVPAAPSTQLRALFFSRINPKKGLLQLLVGLTQVTREIHLSIVGPAEDPRYWQQCQQVIPQLPSHVTVTHQELAQRDEIPELLWNSDCMVLLTAGENYGHVVAEALQAGCPVITTPTTPWTEVVRDVGGDIVADRDNPNEVAALLDSWAAKTSEELIASRHRAKEAFDAFSAKAGPNMIELALASLAARG